MLPLLKRPLYFSVEQWQIWLQEGRINIELTTNERDGFLWKLCFDFVFRNISIDCVTSTAMDSEQERMVGFGHAISQPVWER